MATNQAVTASNIIPTSTLTSISTPISTSNATYTLTINISPPGSGSVSPPGGNYESGLQVSLTANPSNGYVFDYWDGAASGSFFATNVDMNSNKIITAHFKEVETITSSTSTATNPKTTLPPTTGLPSVYYPANNAVDIPLDITFTWPVIDRLDMTYEIAVAENVGGMYIIDYSGTSTTNYYKLPETLKLGTTYEWAVRGVNSTAATAWTMMVFTTVSR